MSKLKYKWSFNINSKQKYYEAKVGNDYLYVFANEWNPDTWMGMYNNCSIFNKTENNKQRKKQGLSLNSHISELTRITLLCNSNPEYMMKKVEYCYINNKIEVNA